MTIGMLLVASANVGRRRVNTAHRDFDDDNRTNLGTDLCVLRSSNCSSTVNESRCHPTFRRYFENFGGEPLSVIVRKEN